MSLGGGKRRRKKRVFPRFRCADDRLKEKRAETGARGSCGGEKWRKLLEDACAASTLGVTKRESLLAWLEHKALNFALGPASTRFDTSARAGLSRATLYKYAIDCQGITYKYLWLREPVQCYTTSSRGIIETNVSDVERGVQHGVLPPLFPTRVYTLNFTPRKRRKAAARLNRDLL